MATTPSTHLEQQPAYRALHAHHGEIADASPPRPLRRRPRPGHPPDRRGCGHLPRLLEASRDRRDAPPARPAGRGGRRGRTAQRDVRRRANQRHREPLGAARRAAHATGAIADRGRARLRRRRPRGARPHGCVRRSDPLGRVDGPHRQVDHQRRQHRHRRLRPRAGDGVQGPAPLQQARHDVPLRLERRRDRLRRSDTRPRPRAHALHRLLEDVHDARDDDERRDGSRLAAGCAGRGLLGRGQAFRRRLDESGRSGAVRHRHRQRIRVLGLGRWPLLDGLCDRPLHDDRGRPGALRARC